MLSGNHTASAMAAITGDFIKITNVSSVFSTYGISAVPTCIVIRPNRQISNQDVWPLSNTSLRSAITTAGGTPSACNVSVEEIELLGFNVFPNPVDDELYFASEQNATVQLFDITGRMLESFDIVSGTANYNCAHLAPGMYTVRAINEEGQIISVKKILKK